MDVFGTSVEALKNVGIVRPGEDVHLTWPEAAMRLFDYDLSDDQKEELLAKAMQTHQAISTAMAAHLALTAENISRSTWLSARMLSKNAESAQIGAREFHNHLLRLKPTTKTLYDDAWLSDDTLMIELGRFCDMEPPCLLWHGGGAFGTCFRCLASRFLGAEDSVMEDEAVHARWKWICSTRRRIALPSLNAILKLTTYLESYGEFPSHTALQPHFDNLRAGRRAMVRDLRDRGEIANNLQSGWEYRERFNLEEVEVDLLRLQLGTAPALPQTPEIA